MADAWRCVKTGAWEWEVPYSSEVCRECLFDLNDCNLRRVVICRFCGYKWPESPSAEQAAMVTEEAFAAFKLLAMHHHVLHRKQIDHHQRVHYITPFFFQPDATMEQFVRFMHQLFTHESDGIPNR
jgi:hypothetical protein